MEEARFSSLLEACRSAGISVHRDRTSMLDISRNLDAEYMQHIRIHPLIRKEGQKLPDVELEVRNLHRDFSKRKFGQADSMVILISLDEGNSTAEVFADADEFADITAISESIKTARMGLELLFAFSSVPEDRRNWYGATVADDWRGSRELEQTLFESGVGHVAVASNEAETEFPIKRSQYAVFAYNMLRKNLTGYVIKPRSERYAHLNEDRDSSSSSTRRIK